MAYLYQYQPKDYQRKSSQLKDKLMQPDIFREEENLITRAITEEFDSNLKPHSIIVEKNHFSFRLYIPAERKSLLELGKRLRNILRNIPIHGIRRMSTNVYAFVEEIHEESGIALLDIVDASVIDQDQEIFDERARQFFEEVGNKENLDRSDIEDRESFVRSFYADVFGGSVYLNTLKSISDNGEVEVGDCFHLSVHHRRSNKPDQWENNSIRLDRIYDYQGFNFDRVPDNNTDFLIINKKGSEKDNKGGAKISEIFSWNPPATSIGNVESHINGVGKSSKKRMIEFRVHDVGQALATSFTPKGRLPLFYFDYGLACGENASTCSANVDLPVEKDTAIILSHIHKDHWLGLSRFNKAFQCQWFIPNQYIGELFKHKLTEIINAGGSVGVLTPSCSSISSPPAFTLIFSNCPKCNLPPKRRDEHLTGFALRVEAQNASQTANLNILICGDQDYRYIDQQYMNDNDILVATHHGGKYSTSKRVQPPKPRQGSSDNIVIYSYGKGNSYGHPSTDSEYQSAGWQHEHRTPTDHDYTKIIMY